MVNRTARRFAWLPLACVLAGAVVPGCSDDPARRQSRSLRQQVAESQRLFQRALEMLGNPLYTRATGQPILLGSVPELTDPNELAVLPAEALDGRALSLLDPSALLGALKECPDARAGDKALAHAQAGRVLELKAWVHAELAANGRWEVQRLLDEAEQVKLGLRIQAGLLKYLDAVLAANPAQATDLAQSAAQQAAEKGAALKTLNQEIQGLTQQTAQLRTSFETLTRQAAELRLQSRATVGKPGLDLVEQVIQKQSQADQIASQLAGLENELADKTARQKVLQEQVQLAEALQKVGQQGLGAAASQSASATAVRQQVLDRIAEGARTLDERVGKAAEQVRQVRQQQDDAANAYELALTHLRNAEGAEPAAQTAARRADVAASLAEMDLQVLEFHKRLAAFGADLSGLWPGLQRPGSMPAGYTALAGDYLGDPNQAVVRAQQACQQAVDLCRTMLPRTEPTYRWVYQGQLGSAYLALYRVAGDRQYLSEANVALGEALEGRAGSPFLSDIAALQLDVKGLWAQAPK